MIHSLRDWLKRKVNLSAPGSAALRPDAGLVSKLIDAGIAAEAAGDWSTPERLFREAVAADPGSAPAHMNLGIALQGQRKFQAAVEAHEAAVRLDPSRAGAYYNLALCRLSLDDPARAESGFRAALRLQPAFPEAWVGLADALESGGRDPEALAALETAISQREHYVGARFNAALLLRKLGRLTEAEKLLSRIPESYPEFANAITALAAVLRDQGRIDEAVAALRAALRKSPESTATQSELLFTLGFSDRVSQENLFTQHLSAGARLEEATPPWRNAFANVAVPERILNIGYLSADFRMHSVAAFVEFLFERHRRDRVRVYAYSSTLQHDSMTNRIIATVDGWQDLRGSTDAAVASAILEDRIDVLVDLSGHTSGSRTGVLAGRAAPVQMTWLGYMDTTGLQRVDYRITDAVADPPGESEAFHTERLARMPHSQWCYRPPEAARKIAPNRDESAGAFTFGALNHFAKVSEAGIALWIAVLRSAPAARLRVVNVPRGYAMDWVVGKLTGAGIDRTRFELLERVPHAEYYAQFAFVDACLDSTPYSGGMTTCDALYLGVPVITLAGSRPVSRSSASLLTTVGSPELVAHSAHDFVKIASGLASDGPRPASARAALRARMMASPLMDEQQFTHELEALYRQAWHEWCARTGRVLQEQESRR